MKKILLTIACLLTSLAMVQAVSLAWVFQSDITPSSDWDGTSLGYAVGMGWVVELVEYDGGYSNVRMGQMGNVLASGVTGPSPLAPNKSVNIIQNVGDSAISVYARIFDGAGHYVNLGVNGGAGFHTTAAGDPSVQEIITAEGFNGQTPTDPTANGTWIAIPEPGTIILFGLGALVIAARRKFRK